MSNQMFLERRKILIFLLVVLFSYFLIISNPSLYFFLNDDFIHIPLAGKRQFLQGFYRPISNLSIWIDYQIWGQNAFGYHLTNVVLHVADTVLVFLLAKRVFSLLSEDSRLARSKSVFAALLFFIYAFHSEPIFWIIGRGASLATLFFLLALLFYLKSWSGPSFHYTLSLIFFALGLLAYEVIWIYPVIILVFLLFFKPTQPELRKLWIVVALFIGFLLLRFVLTRTFLTGYELGSLKDFTLFPLVYKFNTLLARCFLPPMKSSVLFLVLYVGLLIGVVSILVKFRRNRRLLAIFCCLVAAILPVVPLGIDSHDTESERYIYLASVFAVLFIIEVIFQFSRNVVQLCFALLLIGHCYELSKAAASYRFSSMVTKRSLECLPLKVEDTVTALNVPTQFKGALIFRIGLPEALEWFKGVKPENVHVSSQKEIFTSFSHLSCVQSGGNDNLETHDSPEKGPQKARVESNRIFLRWDSDSLLLEKK